MYRRFAFAVIVALTWTAPAGACLWDADTLHQERSRFPTTLELIKGEFLRHSDEFYRWRIEDRQRRLESEPDNLALYDDMAVAWDKLGEPEKAIALMKQKDAIKLGEYETMANLGTFHIHAGWLEEGAEFIRQAIAINPNAHFGREVYQLKLVEYVLSKREEDGTVPQPLSPEVVHESAVAFGFAGFLASEHDATSLTPKQLALARKGVQGMMRFGHYDSPVLLEALGDLLSHYTQDEYDQQMAAWAYLRASQKAGDKQAAAAFYAKAEAVIAIPVVFRPDREPPEETLTNVPQKELINDSKDLSVIEEELAGGLAYAEEWITRVHDDERAWVEHGSGINPDAESERLYGSDPYVATPNMDAPVMWKHEMIKWGLWVLAGCLIVVTISGLISVWRFLKWRTELRRQRRTTQSG